MNPGVITISNGDQEAKIYQIKNRGKEAFQLSYYEAGVRVRRTFKKVSKARREAKLVLGCLASTALDAQRISTPELEGLALAQRHLAGIGTPIHVCAEVYAEAHRILAGVSLLEAVRFYREFHPTEGSMKSLAVLGGEFAKGRKAMGVHADYVATIERQLNRLAASFPGKTLPQLRTAELDQWLGEQKWRAASKNDTRKILIAFGNWAKKQSYLPTNRPTEFDGMLLYKEPPTKVTIYTPKELADLFAITLRRRPRLIPWLACAAFTGARVAELDKLDWSHIYFDRGFVEVASTKVRSKARRLVPLSDTLRAWLLPYRQKSGPINVYFCPQANLSRIAAKAGLTVKNNGFRHSYISYRLAEINDTARVALECGNSPDVIFQHYRELVTPAESAAYLGMLPAPGQLPPPAEELADELPVAA